MRADDRERETAGARPTYGDSIVRHARKVRARSQPLKRRDAARGVRRRMSGDVARCRVVDAGGSAMLAQASQDLVLPSQNDVEAIGAFAASWQHHQKALIVRRDVVIGTAGLRFEMAAFK